jgi:O-succinylbenzoic acid--CoA ligase
LRPEPFDKLRTALVEGRFDKISVQALVSLVAVSAAGPAAIQLRMVESSDVAASLADSLHGGPPIAPLPVDPVERTRAIMTLQPSQPITEADAGAVIATSGSTEAPKGVVLSRAAIRTSVEATHHRLGGAGDWVLALPVHYVAGFMVLARACLACTRAVRVGADLNDLPQVLGGLIARRYISLVPAQLDRALQRPELSEALASFNSVLIGGGPANAELVERATAFGIRVVTTYGMSETCGGCVYDGEPLHGVDVELTDDGQIMIGSRSLFSGYRLRPDLTAAALIDGKFRTQDRGRWQAGRLMVLGRTDDIVITGGHKVDLGEVERCIQRWAAERHACAVVLGIPDAAWGTLIIAVSDSARSLEDLQGVVCQSLPGYALPRELIHLDPLPVLPSGKPDRVVIKSMIMETLAKRQAPV